MALNSMFFERVLVEIGGVISKMKELSDINLEELSYQEGKAFLCYQIYRQNIHNPKLREMAEKRIASIKELRLNIKNKIPPPVVSTDVMVELSIDKINNMKSAELKKAVINKGLILKKYTVEPMREALIGELDEKC